MEHLFLTSAYINLPLALLLAFLVMPLGYWPQRLLAGANRPIDGTTWLISFLTGFCLLGWVMLILACGQLLTAPVIYGLLGTQILILAAGWKSFSEDMRASLKLSWSDIAAAWQNSKDKPAIVLMLASSAFVVGLGLLKSLPPTLEADSISAYLNAANLFRHFGGLIDVGHVVGNMAKQGFMPMVYALTLGNSLLVQIWLFLIFLAGAFLFFLAFVRSCGPAATSLVLLIFLSMGHHIVLTFGVAKVDGMGLTFAIAALIAWLRYDEKGERLSLVLCALFTGFVASLSYMNLMAGPVFGFLCASSIFKHHLTAKQRLQAFGLWAGVASLIVAPGYFYNWVHFGNPLYPFLSKIFGHGLGDPSLDARGYFYGNMNNALIDEWRAKGFWDGASLPLTLLHNPVRIQGFKESVFAVFWIFSTFGAIWFLVRPTPTLPRRMAANLCIAYVFLYAPWAWGQYVFRYFALGWPLIFWFGLQALQRIFTTMKDERKVLALSLILTILAVSYSYVPKYVTKGRAMDAVHQLQIKGGWEPFLSENFFYRATDQNDTLLPIGKGLADIRPRLKPGDKVLSFVPGHFYLGEEIIVFSGNGGNTMPSPLALTKPLYLYNTAEDLRTTLKSNGFNYLLIHPHFLYLKGQENVIMQEWMRLYTPAWESAGILTYKLD